MLEMQEYLHTLFLLAVILIHQNGSQYYYYDFVYSLLTVFIFVRQPFVIYILMAVRTKKLLFLAKLIIA